MDFTFDETQQEVQNLARKILSEVSTPERLNTIDQQAQRFDTDLWQQLAQAGLLGVALSEANGGMGFGFTELCLFVEEVGRTVAAVPVIPVLVSAALPIQQFGNAEQQQLLVDVASGKALITAGLSEYLAEDPTQPATTAQLQDKHYQVNGTKIAVPFADQAERILISANSEQGVVILLLNPKATGVTLHSQVSTTGEPWFEVQMDNVLIDAADVLVGVDQGAAAAQWIYERTTAAYCAMQLGVSEASLQMTATFTCEREQFGVPIGSFQAVQHRAADCFIDVQCLKLTTYQAVSRLDLALPASNELLIAKIWAGDTGHRVSYASQHLHGGTGIDKDYYLWRYNLWARQIEMIMGCSSALLARLGARIAQGEAFAE